MFIEDKWPMIPYSKRALCASLNTSRAISHDLPKIHSSALDVVSLVMYSLSELSKTSPAGLKHPELREGPLPAHLVTSGFHMISLYPVVELTGATGLYDPSVPLAKGTCTSLKPVVGERFQDPWKLTYKLAFAPSNLLSIGAECAMKMSDGSVIFVLQVASENVVFGERTKGSPDWRPVKSLASHTWKHVGYPYQLLFGVEMSPM